MILYQTISAKPAKAGDDAGCRYAIHDEPYGVLKGFRVEINRVNSSAV